MKFRGKKFYTSPRDAFENLRYGQRIKTIGGRLATVKTSRLEAKGIGRVENCIIDVLLNGGGGWTCKWNEISLY